MAFLKMEVGDCYTLDVPGHGQVTWTKGNPTPDVDIPLDVLQRAGLLTEKVPFYDREGQTKGEKRRFKVVPRPQPVKATPVDPLEDENLDLGADERELLRAEAQKTAKGTAPTPKK